MNRRLGFVCLSVSCIAVIGCGNLNRIEVDLSTATPRIVISGRTWGWPFVWPRVSGIAIATDTEPVWELESVDKAGVPARNLAIIYGEVPGGFTQTYPGNDARPGRVVPGKTYFVGATGPNEETYRAIFALPVDPLGAPPNPEFEPDRKKMDPAPSGN